MKIVPLSINQTTLNGPSLKCTSATCTVTITAYSPSIFKISYDVFGYEVPAHLVQASDYLVEAKPDPGLEVEGERSSIKCTRACVTASESDSNISVYYDGVLVHGGALGTSDTVISHSQFRLLGPKGSEYGRFSFPLDKDDRFYGLGDKGGSPDRRNRRFRMYNRDALGYDAQTSDPLYKSVPFFIKHNPRTKTMVGLFFPQSMIDSVDLGLESPFYYGLDIAGGPFCYFAIVGSDYKSILRDYCKLNGLPALPPLYSFGYFGSSMNYAEAWDAQARILKFFQDTEDHDLPCEGMYVSSGYLKADDGKRYSFFWNKRKFPDPKAFITSLVERGYHLTFNIKPGILTTHPWYKALEEKGYFIKGLDGKALVEFFWGGNASFIDFSNPEAKQWWKTKLNEAYLDYGASGIWNDNNELELEDSAQEAFQTRTLYPVMMAQTAFETSLEHNPGLRPWIYSRSGYSKLQKYARTWTGDNSSSFKTLEFNQFQSLSLGLSAMPYVGHDLGGFYGEEPTAELLIRSCQSAVFQPRFVIHSWRQNDEPTEPWKNLDAFGAIKQALEDHYHHMPYIYSTAYESSQKGLPMDRPLFLEYPEDHHLTPDLCQSLFGPFVLKAPVVTQGATTLEVYFPKGDNWFCPFDQKVYQGGSSVILDAPLSKYWYFYKVGSVIPKTASAKKLQTSFFSNLEFHIQPKCGVFEYTYFEDDGVSQLASDSYNLWSISTQYDAKSRKGQIEVQIRSCGNQKELERRTYGLVLPKGFTSIGQFKVSSSSKLVIPFEGEYL